MNEWEDTSWLYEVQFADGTAQAGVSYYVEYGYYAAASVLGGVISMTAFALILVTLIGKIRYIDLMEPGDTDTEGGPGLLADYGEGKGDELASWHRKSMPCAAIKERQQKEEEAGKGEPRTYAMHVP